MWGERGQAQARTKILEHDQHIKVASEFEANRCRRQAWLDAVILEGEDPVKAAIDHQRFFDEWEELAFTKERNTAPTNEEYSKRVTDLYNLVWQEETWLRRHRESAMATGLFFTLLCQQGEFEKAVEVNDRWLAQTDVPEDEEVYSASFLQLSGMVFLKLGRVDEGVDCFRRILQLDARFEGLVTFGMSVGLQEGSYPDGAPVKVVEFAADLFRSCGNLKPFAEKVIAGMSVEDFSLLIERARKAGCEP